MLVCSSCATAFPVDRPRWRCECGSYLVLADAGMFSRCNLPGRPMSLWRYREALGLKIPLRLSPSEKASRPLRTRPWVGFPVMLKLDFLCPTGSHKNRGSAVMISKLKRLESDGQSSSAFRNRRAGSRRKHRPQASRIVTI